MERINKPDACRRQLDEAIRMLFGGADILAVHTVAAAAFQIAFDLCERRGDIHQSLHIKNMIRPGMERVFWNHFNGFANFLKHADRDPDSIIEIKEMQADFLILAASQMYFGLGYEATLEMRVFTTWYAACNPELINKGSALEAELHKVPKAKNFMAQLVDALASASKQERLSGGRYMLEAARGGA